MKSLLPVAVHEGRRSTGVRFEPRDVSPEEALSRPLPRLEPADPGVPVDTPAIPVNVRLATTEELEALAPLAGIARLVLEGRGGAR